MDEKTKGEITRARILEVATSLINRQGFKHTSINDLIKATGIKKGNLYYHFPSKEDLGMAILKEVDDAFFHFLSNSLHGKGPLEKLSNFFDAIFEKHNQTNFVGGCIMGNMALEMSDSNDRFSAVVKDVFTRWEAVITGLLSEAQESGILKSGMAPAVLAKHIVATIEGGIMLARVSKNGGDLAQCLDSLRCYLGMR
ncbi:MAG: TetR/AcrR family transcriptional regulator [Deltaproteobacteria bacterium]|nr:TetR/AcrR family transcriptional regulator [Deltaproteobacteria bacterium]